VFNLISNDYSLICEFGVWKGRRINYLARKFPQVTVNGFDSFTGLPEKLAGNDLDQGYFNLSRDVPNIEKNVKLYVGNFVDTIPKFMDEILNSLKIDLLVTDCDIYCGTKTVLT
jgi:tRNA G46 methylase TrmB